MQNNKPKKFTLVINSLNYSQRFTNVNDQEYTIDATNIESGNYKCRLSFRGNVETAGSLQNADAYATIYLSLGTPQQNYVCDSRNVFMNSTLVGYTNVYTLSDVAANNRAYCSSSYDTNPPFYLRYRIGNTLRVTLRAGTTNNLFAGVNNYLLLIEMVKIDEDEN